MSELAYQDAPAPLNDRERHTLQRVFSDFMEVPGEWKNSLAAWLEANPPILGKAVLGGQTISIPEDSILSIHIVDGAITDVDINPLNKDGTAATPSLRTLGTGADQAASGNDARFDVAKRITYDVKQKAADYAIVAATDSVIVADSTTATVTITLPLAGSFSGRQFFVKRVNAGANNVILAASGADTIDGAATKTLSAQWSGITVVAEAGTWVIQAVVGTVT